MFHGKRAGTYDAGEGLALGGQAEHDGDHAAESKSIPTVDAIETFLHMADLGNCVISWQLSKSTRREVRRCSGAKIAWVEFTGQPVANDAHAAAGHAKHGVRAGWMRAFRG